MGERRGTKALELWCRRVTEGYPGVDVSNMTTSWRDGLAFCALIHRFRPDLIDFASLRSSEARYNNELAFRVAERHLGIPALLDAEDMVDSVSPDRLSVLTYLAQFYQTFGQASLAMGIISPGRSSAAAKRQSEGSVSGSPTTPNEGTQAKKVWRLPRDPCASCGLPVFLAERLACSGRIFHRTCFKCARCGAQLSPANCYETESRGFCCEVCPDEEPPPPPESSSDNEEEDTASVGGSCDEYSASFESVLEGPGTPPLSNPALSAFLSTQLTQPESVTHDPPDLPAISTSVKNDFVNNSSTTAQEKSIIENELHCSTNQSTSSDLKICDSNTQNNTDSVEGDNSMCSSSLELRKSSNGSISSLVSSRRNMFENLIQNEDKPVVSRKSSASSIKFNELISHEDKKINNEKILAEMTSDDVKNIENEKLNVSHINRKTAEDDVTNMCTENKTDDIAASPVDITLSDNVKIIDEKAALVVNLEREESNAVPIPAAIVDMQINDEGATDDVGVTTESKTDIADDKCIEISNATPEVKTEDIYHASKPPVPAARTLPADQESSGVFEEIKVARPRVVIEPVPESPTQYPDDLNPFGDDGQEETVPKRRASTNPFESSDEEEDVKPVPLRRKLIPIDAHLNPFWEDGEEEETAVPIPRPRSQRSHSPDMRPSPAPRQSAVSPSPGKKKPAPPPPPSPAALSPVPSPRGSLRPARKSRPAPRPPGMQQPSGAEQLMKLGEKNIKDELNRTRQGLVSSERLAPEKSHTGQWKRKKGPAPALPIPPKRQVHSDIPPNEIRRELELIEVQQRGLEKQGVRLEEQIREQLAQCGCDNDNDEASLPPEVEDNVLQLFELVNEKNELFRRQAEFMYLKRQTRLEEQQAELEWQIRCLLQKPNKGGEDLSKEEELIARLVDVVEQRNQIVDCLEMDRKREADEDESVRERLQKFSTDRNQPQTEEVTLPKKSKKHKIRLLPKDKSKSKDKAAKKEEKKNKKKESSPGAAVAADSSTEVQNGKKHSKKKWFS